MPRSNDVTKYLIDAQQGAWLLLRDLQDAKAAATATESLVLLSLTEAAAHVQKSIEMLQAARSANA